MAVQEKEIDQASIALTTPKLCPNTLASIDSKVNSEFPEMTFQVVYGHILVVPSGYRPSTSTHKFPFVPEFPMPWNTLLSYWNQLFFLVSLWSLPLWQSSLALLQKYFFSASHGSLSISAIQCKPHCTCFLCLSARFWSSWIFWVLRMEMKISDGGLA